MRFAGSLRVAALLALGAIAWPSLDPASAAEPPAIVEAPPAPAKDSLRREVWFEAAVQNGYAHMGGWNDGMKELVQASHSSPGLMVATTNLPAYTVSFDALALARVAGPFMVGLHYDRPAGKSEFSVIETGSGTDLTEYPSEAEATSNVWMLAVRWLVPVGRGTRARGTRAKRGSGSGILPYVQAGAGAGSARLTFSTSSGGAQGKGHAFAGNLEGGVHVGNGPLRFRFAAGYRFHRVPLGYSSVRATSQPGASRYFFDFDDELRDFATGRDLDLGGGFARLGLSWAREL